MKLVIGDYVEGYETYGNKIGLIRGMIYKIKYNEKDELVKCEIQCDDYYHGARCTNLIISKYNYEIKKVEKEENWYLNMDRFSVKDLYRIGLDTDFLLSKDVVRFFDVDGVLAVYAFGKSGINVCDDADFVEYIKNVNPYYTAMAPDLMQRYILDYTNKKDVFVVSKSFSQEENEYKKQFIIKNYYNYIPEENIYFTNTDDKSGIISNILENKYNGISTRHMHIDDNIYVLNMLEKKGITTIHVSSIFNLSSILYKAT